MLWCAGALYGLSLFLGMLKTSALKARLWSHIPLLAIAVGFFFQTRGLYLRGMEAHGCPLGNTMERIQFILWSLILAFLILRLVWKLNLLGSFCAGLAFIGGWASLSFPSLDTPYWKAPGFDRLFADPWIELHASIAVFSYGLFSLLAVVSAMYLFQRKSLLSRKYGKLASFLPPIHDLEHAAFRLLLVGVVFLTLSIVVGGMHWTRHPEFVTSAKLAVTILLWLGYCILFFLRLANRLYGSKFAKACLALFVVALASLSLVSSKKKKASEVSDHPGRTALSPPSLQGEK